MSNLCCNNCGTSQRAEVLECSIPFRFDNDGIEKFFLLKVESCAKCGQKKIQPVCLTYSGIYVRMEFLKKRFFEKAERSVLRSLANLPNICRNSERGGFYLNYGEYGAVKRCYSNLSTLKMGLHLANNGCEAFELAMSKQIRRNLGDGDVALALSDKGAVELKYAG